VAGILATDLLVGIGLGMGVAIFAILLTNYNNPFFFDRDPDEAVRLTLSEDVSFLNRAAILRTLAAIPSGATVVIDARRSMNIDHDVFEILKDFEQRAAVEGINLRVLGLDTLRRSNDAMHRVQALVPPPASATATS
jgi:MFS superfamily sulfate permease-like transporter